MPLADAAYHEDASSAADISGGYANIGRNIVPVEKPLDGQGLVALCHSAHGLGIGTLVEDWLAKTNGNDDGRFWKKNNYAKSGNPVLD